MGNIVVLGAQWGDEGKGKVVDLFSEKFSIVARYQGGHNAGHTVFIGEKKFVLKLIPSGVLRPGIQAVIGNGVVIDPAALLDEMEILKKAGIDVAKQLAISNRAHVIFPFHRMVEKMSEAREDRVPIGTTSRGIGPCYEDKIGRRGIRIADLYERESFCAMYTSLAEDKQLLAQTFNIQETIDYEKIRDQYLKFADRIRPMVCDTAQLLHDAMQAGKRVLFEGAQGSMLDVDHGTYPFVTSSSATAGGACTGAGVPPTSIHGVIGVSKAYTTRVGSGPFPTELQGRRRRTDSQSGQRIRRSDRASAPLRMVRCSAAALHVHDQRLSSLVVTKLDVLDQFDEIQVCTSYRNAKEMPATFREMENVEPVYETLPGWKSETRGLSRADALPPRAKDYLKFLSERTGVEIGCISTGPERDETILIEGSKLAGLL